jgi:prolyl oligopeptidase
MGATSNGANKFPYPKTRRTDLEEELHQTRVADPYRWMEDLDSEETRKWIERQNELTFDFLGSVPERDSIRERLRQLWNYERFSPPRKRAGRYFYFHNDGLQDQSILYWMEGLEGEPKILIDPNELSDDGTIALTTIAVSDNGRLVAYGLSSAGSDWVEIRVREVDTCKDLDDHLKWAKFTNLAWSRDGKGFFYSGYDEPKANLEYKEAHYFHKLRYHKLGTPQDEDEITYERGDRKELLFFAEVTEDGRYLVITAQSGTQRENALFCKDLDDPEGEVEELFADFDAEYSFVGNEGDTFYAKTDLDAPLGRCISFDSKGKNRSLRTVVPEGSDQLEHVGLLGGRLLTIHLHDAKSRLSAYTAEGELIGDIPLPEIGSVGAATGRHDDPECFFYFTSFTNPGTIFRMSMDILEYDVFKKPQIDFDPNDFSTEQVFYESKDGTRVPMFLCHRKDLKKTGDQPVLLSGYGGFGSSTRPFFSVPNTVWMEMGGILARPNLRGGSEYGTEWHDQGKLLNKQNVFDDFISAAEWLIEKGYTNKGKLAIAGASNGGLLVGACMTQRPDLFGACLPDVGVMDMLRFHKFTIGWAWTSDYGSPEDREHFEALLSYSPYHNVREGTSYPPTLVTTADHDDRVFPAHSFKFTAALQHAHRGNAPVLIRVEKRAGHGALTPVSKRIDTAADKWAFLIKELGMQPSLPGYN